MNKLHLLPPIKVAEELLLMDSCALRKIRPEELKGESWLGRRKVRNFSMFLILIGLVYTYAFINGQCMHVYISVFDVRCHIILSFLYIAAIKVRRKALYLRGVANTCYFSNC